MKVHKRFVLFALLAVFTGLGLTTSAPHSGLAQTAAKPNILFILADDLRASDLKYMPRTQNLLNDRGTEFTKAWVTRSLCCPSRASTLRGQYTHNHRVWVNVPPSGGFWKFRDRGLESSTIATWLDDPDNFADRVDYDTILIGKYLNRYGLNRAGGYAPTTYVPPGWDHWHAWEGDYYSADTYDINQNGRIVRYRRSQIHDTDLHARTAENFIRRTAGGAPFFMHLSPNAPHSPSYYPRRHAGMFKNTPLPRPSSFNEHDVSDKPRWLRRKSKLSSGQISSMTTYYRNRLRSLQSVDEMVGRLIDALRDTGELSRTHIVFTSDNGIYLGEHRLQNKAAGYNAAPRVPLLIRGPGVPEGVNRSQMALNNDLAPTFASWAGVRPPRFVDGRSLRPLLNASPPKRWRNAFLVEHRRSPEEYSYVRAIPAYNSLRTSRYSYTEYATGERELYRLERDPYERYNVYKSASSRLISNLHARLAALKRCSGTGQTRTSCEEAEGG